MASTLSSTGDIEFIVHTGKLEKEALKDFIKVCICAACFLFLCWQTP